jgi:S1-C subfamily serine protease
VLAAAALALASCGGESSGITARQIGLRIEPLDEVRFAREIRQIGRGSPPYGASISRVLKAEEIDGVWVAGARPRSPAAKAGLQTGDLITSVNGDEVTTPAAVDNALDGAEAGSSVEVEGRYVASGDPTQFLDSWSEDVELPGG